MTWILIGRMDLTIHRLQEEWAILATIHFERLYVIFALIALILYSRRRLIPNIFHLAVFFFLASTFFSWFSSPWHQDEGAAGIVDLHWKEVVFYFMLVMAVPDRKSFERLITGFACVICLYTIHSFREFLCGRCNTSQGLVRMIGVGVVGNDPNSFGGTLAFTLPFVVPIWNLYDSRKVHLAILGYVGLSLLCIIKTGSRASLLTFFLFVFFFGLQSRYRLRFAAYVAVAAPIIWFVMPVSLQNRFLTIFFDDVGPKIAYSSAESRTKGFWLGIELLERYPLSGCGPGVWIPATGRIVQSHNLYGQVMGETGIVGILAFGSVLACLVWNYLRIRSIYSLHPEWGHDFLWYVAWASIAGVGLLLLGGWAGHNLWRWNWLWYGAFLVIVRDLAERRASEPAEDGMALPGIAEDMEDQPPAPVSRSRAHRMRRSDDHF